MMPTPEEVGLYIFILAGFLGYHVISRGPPLLHTPLMSATNAISGISLIGSLVVAGSDHGPVSTILGLIAVACSSTNVVGGFLITDRMLSMFKTAKEQESQKRWYQLSTGAWVTLGLIVAGLLALVIGFEEMKEHATKENRDEALKFLYIVSAVLF